MKAGATFSLTDPTQPESRLRTLATGGTVYIPSATDRMNDLSGAIRKSNANRVHMTPSVAGVLDSDIGHSLDVLGLGERPFLRVTLLHGVNIPIWSFLTVLRSVQSVALSTIPWQYREVGKEWVVRIGSTTWITNPDDHN